MKSEHMNKLILRVAKLHNATQALATTPLERLSQARGHIIVSSSFLIRGSDVSKYCVVALYGDRPGNGIVLGNKDRTCVQRNDLDDCPIS